MAPDEHGRSIMGALGNYGPVSEMTSDQRAPDGIKGRRQNLRSYDEEHEGILRVLKLLAKYLDKMVRGAHWERIQTYILEYYPHPHHHPQGDVWTNPLSQYSDFGSLDTLYDMGSALRRLVQKDAGG